MAFRKRNVAIGGGIKATPEIDAATSASGVRPSPLTSHPVTSTGTPTLDELLGGHAGLALGSTVLIEESGATDYAGALLRFFAAEGICHDHVVHVVGMGEGWIRDLPGVAEQRRSERPTSSDEEKMKIAWRYERLGQAGERALPDRTASKPGVAAEQQRPFCHTFDLTKKLVLPPTAKINHIPITSIANPFDTILRSLKQSLASSPPTSTHRLVIPMILSPALYPPSASQPSTFLRFLHTLRTLPLTTLITLPLELYPRHTALVRWAEILSDGVLELTPFPHALIVDAKEEQPQGMLKVHKLPLVTERSEGGAGPGNTRGDDLAFTVSRRKFSIKPFALPPLEGDQEAQQDAGGKPSSKDLEF